MKTDGFLNSPEALEGLKLMRDIHHVHGVAPVSKQKDMFYNDQVAFFCGAPIHLNPIRKARPDIDLATAPIPFMRTPIVHAGSFAWLANRRTAKMAEAKLFVNFMGDARGNDPVARGWSSLPIRRLMPADRPELAEAPMKLFVDATLEWSAPRPRTPGFSELDSIWTKLEADIVAGGDPRALADDAVRRIDAQLRRHA